MINGSSSLLCRTPSFRCQKTQRSGLTGRGRYCLRPARGIARNAVATDSGIQPPRMAWEESLCVPWHTYGRRVRDRSQVERNEIACNSGRLGFKEKDPCRISKLQIILRAISAQNARKVGLWHVYGTRAEAIGRAGVPEPTMLTWIGHEPSDARTCQPHPNGRSNHAAPDYLRIRRDTPVKVPVRVPVASGSTIAQQGSRW